MTKRICIQGYSLYFISCTRGKSLGHDNSMRSRLAKIWTLESHKMRLLYFIFFTLSNCLLLCPHSPHIWLIFTVTQLHMIFQSPLQFVCLVSVPCWPAVTETERWILYYWPLTTALSCASLFVNGLAQETHIYLVHCHVTVSAWCSLHQLESLLSTLHSVFASVSDWHEK